MQLLLDSDYDKVISVSRRKLDIEHEKLEQQVVPFDELHSLEKSLVGDDVFCCLGSTIKKAGSKEKFILYDYTYPVEFARITLTNGAKQFHLVSSRGANKKSLFFYTRVKGDLEETISNMEFKSTHIYQPSLLLGDRKEFRLGEKIGEYISYLMYPVSFLFKNSIPVHASRVAKAMISFARQDKQGLFFHPSKEIQEYK